MSIRRVIKIRYAQIRSLDLSNGEGVGVALFVQGCHFHCLNCFNPETWDFNGGKEWTEETKEKFLRLVDRPYIKRVSLLGGECLAEENLDDVLDLVTEINDRYNTSHDRIRLSSPQKSIWLYTGYKTFGITKEFWGLEPNIVTDKVLEPQKLKIGISNLKKRSDIICQCDVLVDGRYVEAQRDITLPWAGSSNQRVIRIQESLQKGEIVLWQT